MKWAAVELPDPETPVGARGIGEPPVGAGCCAILNALSDALGDEIFRRAPVNAVWPWGGGKLPHSVRSEAGVVMTKDVELAALSALAGLSHQPAPVPGALVDVRQLRDAQRLETLLVDALREGFEPLLDFADGARWNLRSSQRWRFWRKAMPIST